MKVDTIPSKRKMDPCTTGLRSATAASLITYLVSSDPSTTTSYCEISSLTFD